jgi:hypothetical protein
MSSDRPHGTMIGDEPMPPIRDNVAIAELHIRRIVGPTILMGDGSYFDYENPAATEMTIEDYAYGLAYTCRFRGQTRSRLIGSKRCFYSVAQHCELLARALLDDGYSDTDAFAGLMHESGEVVWGDMPGPCKPLVPDFRAREKEADQAIGRHFNVEVTSPALIKRYDLRMLATEKRDLMPQSGNDEWHPIDGLDLGAYAPFDWEILPYKTPDRAAEEFLRLHERLAPKGAPRS